MLLSSINLDNHRACFLGGRIRHHDDGNDNDNMSNCCLSMILPLTNLTAQYVSAFGGSTTSWYTNSAAQTQYRAYIKAVVSRYASSPAVFAWELANEPRCKGCATSVINKWASDTSAYVKSLDSNHMVTLGDEGFGLTTGTDNSYPFSYSEGVDFEANLKISTLDFGTFHLYPESWGTSYDWGNTWVKAHAAACKAAGKPCLFEECEYSIFSPISSFPAWHI